MKQFDHIPEELTPYHNAYLKLLDAMDEIENKFKAYETESINELQKQNLFQSYLGELERISNFKDEPIVRETVAYVQKKLEDHLFQLNVQTYVLKDMFSSFTDQKQATYALKSKKIGIGSSLQMLEL